MFVFKRVKSQNFYVARVSDDFEILKSYNTIVGLLDKKYNICYSVKYTRTTNKQVTEYFKNYIRDDFNRQITIIHSGDRVFVTAKELKDIIFRETGLLLDTGYNKQYYNSIL